MTKTKVQKSAPAEPAEPAKRGRPPVDEPRERVAIRLLDEEKHAFQAEGVKRGLPYTTWMRIVCRKACGLDPS
jgi:hypothetical protein